MAELTAGTERLLAQTAPAVKLKLVAVSGPDFGAELLLDRGRYSVGHGAENALVLKDRSVSRVHLELEVLPHSAKVSDAGSTNGSFYDGLRFQQLELPPGAVIRIGLTELQLLPAGARVPSRPSERTSFGALFGTSLKVRQTFALLERLAPAQADVLVQGETGTGKELCAEALHANSARAQGPFVICDLAGVTPSLFESELFGHVKGAFTGATSDRAGAFERAHGGTLFLDEVGELPKDVQPRLLRFLERRQVKRVGANDYRQVDVRVIAATHRDLLGMVKTQDFREDLYHRLAVFCVTLVPLRERLEDLDGLVDQLLTQKGLSPDAVTASTRALLRGYGWPGNVRELRNVIDRAAQLGEVSLPTSDAPAAASPPLIVPAHDVPFKEAKERLIAAFERDYVESLLTSCEGNISKAARKAGIDRVSLRRLLVKHGLRAAKDDDGEA
jgi:DNA-binding NtrC family response regulator